MRKRWAVIADDFTGAGDSGVHFALSGFRTALVLDGAGLEEAYRHHQTVSFSTESRFSPPEEAAAAVAKAVRACRAAGADLFFKKIDSTLRGNLGPEIRAMLDTGGFAAALLCTGMPKTGRTIIDGRLLVRGVPVHETELSRDPFNPVPCSVVAELLPCEDCGCIGLEEIRKGGVALAETILARAGSGCGVLVADAETDADLKILGEALRGCMLDAKGRQRILPVGAGGLAEGLVEKGGVGVCPDPTGRLLAVVGSLTAVSREQAERAASSGLFTVLEIDLPAALANEEKELARIISGLDERGNSPILVRNAVLPAGGNLAPSREDGLRAAGIFARAARAIAVRADCRRLYVTGGSTAVAVAGELGLTSVTLVKECSPGVVLSSCRSDRAPVDWFITKAGGFGAPDTLVHLVDK